MATLDLADSEGIGHQVAGELGVDYHDCIGDSVYLWIEEVIETRRDLWLPLGKRPAVEGMDLQSTWATKLKEELKQCDAPVLAKLKGSLDPDRAVLALGYQRILPTISWLEAMNLAGGPCRRLSLETRSTFARIAWAVKDTYPWLCRREPSSRIRLGYLWASSC